jgi:hypothetical protein
MGEELVTCSPCLKTLLLSKYKVYEVAIVFTHLYLYVKLCKGGSYIMKRLIVTIDKTYTYWIIQSDKKVTNSMLIQFYLYEYIVMIRPIEK